MEITLKRQFELDIAPAGFTLDTVVNDRSLLATFDFDETASELVFQMIKFLSEQRGVIMKDGYYFDDKESLLLENIPSIYDYASIDYEANGRVLNAILNQFNGTWFIINKIDEVKPLTYDMLLDYMEIQNKAKAEEFSANQTEPKVENEDGE